MSSLPSLGQINVQVFVRERLNGYYGVSQFAVANTLSGAPFIFLIAALSSMPVIYLAQLNTDRSVSLIVVTLKS